MKIPAFFYVIASVLLLSTCVSTDDRREESRNVEGFRQSQETTEIQDSEIPSAPRTVFDTDPYSTQPLPGNQPSLQGREKKMDQTYRKFDCESDVSRCYDLCITGGIAGVVTGDLTAIFYNSALRDKCEGYCRHEYDCPANQDPGRLPGIGKSAPQAGK